MTLVDELLAEQRNLSAVERFTQKHENLAGHAHEPFYRDLIPLSKPAAGEQYAFAVNLDRCSGCKACVSACHSLNGLEEHETWRDTGVIVGRSDAYHQTVTTACHHCAEPGCLEGCPVMAYEKDAETGIVRHLDDQCIGCQYCTMKCPYEVPKYSKRLGIVRKCDMCHDRLAVGEAPACVQACPHEAITIRLVDKKEVSAATPGTQMVPGAFDSSYTKPSTRYFSSKPIPAGSKAADADSLHLEHAHPPLILMLVLSQMAVGLLLGLVAVAVASPATFATLGFVGTATAFVVLNAGLAASIFHLGRPLGAWRFFLGLRTSWMSREILAFGMLAAAASGATGACWLLPGSSVAAAVVAATAFVGVAAVFTSAMIYIDTRRAFWRAGLTLPRFFGAVGLLGLTTAAALVCRVPTGGGLSIGLGTAAVIVRAGLFAWEAANHLRALADPGNSSHLPARKIHFLTPWVPQIQIWLFVTSTAFAVLGVFSFAGLAGIWTALALIGTLAAVFVERYTFFAAVQAPRMPGVAL